MGVVGSHPVCSMKIRDRHTGHAVEEKVPAYLKTAYQLMYQNPIGRTLCKVGPIQRLLKSTTAKQGNKMDLPESQAAIPKFIQLYGVDITEAELSIDQYKTFNDFFARRLKSGVRPVHSPDNPAIITSPADCRLLVYNNLSDTATIWLKGQQLSIQDMIGDDKELNDIFKSLENPAVCIARLAPNDYHRWHMPCAGTVGKQSVIDGTYYSVSPRAVRNANILASNKRVICAIHSDEQQARNIGDWLLIPVGAAMVSSISFSEHVKPGAKLSKGDEHGYFQFGGSTIVLLFDSSRVVWDRDLIDSSNSAVETLIKMGDRIGTIVTPDERATYEAAQHDKTVILPSLLDETEEDVECDDAAEQPYGDHNHLHVNSNQSPEPSAAHSTSNTATPAQLKSPTKSPLKRNRDIERLIQENERDPSKRKVSIDLLADNYLI